jgi:hypothetical protein
VINTEPFLVEALASLKAGLPGQLAAIDALYTDFDLVPDFVPDADNYWTGVVRKPLKYPIVEVAVPDWTMTGFDINQMAADCSFPMFVSATLRVVEPAAQHSDKLYRLCMRYVRAILNTLLVPGAFGQGAVVNAVRGAYRQNPETRDREEIIGAALVAFTLESQDQRE